MNLLKYVYLSLDNDIAKIVHTLETPLFLTRHFAIVYNVVIK
jgi:hypothetical protein